MNAEDYFKKEWGTAFYDATLSSDKGLLKLAMKDIYGTMERYANQQKVSVSDEEIEKEAWQRYGEVMGGQYHADRPYNRKCFMNGAKWMRSKLSEEKQSGFPDCRYCKESYHDCKCESGGYYGDCEGTGV